MELSIIIINYNVKYFLELCLHSVIKAVKDIDAEILVGDNNSSDGSKAYLTPLFPSVKFTWNNDNPGFGKANNRLLKDAKGRFILFLNPDTVLSEDSLIKCLEFLKNTPDAGATGIRMIDGTGCFLKESKRSFPSITASLFKMAGLAALFPSSRLFAEYYAGHLSQYENNQVDVLAGAFMMIKKEVLDKTGGFDEDFFMYGEDIDLSYRILKEGYKNYYFAETSIIHFKGESTQRNSKNYLTSFYGAMHLFVNKHSSDKKSAVLTHAAIKLARVAAGIRYSLKGRTLPAPLNSETAIAAVQQKFDNLLHLIKHARIPVLIKGRIALKDSDKGNQIGNLSHPDLLKKNRQFYQLIFTEGDLSFKDIIVLMEKLHNKFSFMLHAGNSNSIVGSSKKDARGNVIAVSDPSDNI